MENAYGYALRVTVLILMIEDQPVSHWQVDATGLRFMVKSNPVRAGIRVFRSAS